jgi:hypothetical protein
MENVKIESVVFKTVDDIRLRMDIYYPPGFERDRSLPAVILHNATAMETVDREEYRDWGKLLAVSGIIGIGHQSRFFKSEDSRDLVLYITSHAKELCVDTTRLGIWTASGNTIIGFPLVMERNRDLFRCAAFYYGMPDPETVETFKPLRQDVPLFIVRCGLDEFRASRNIDDFVRDALDIDLDVEFINYLEGHHAFDIVDDTDRSRDIIRKTLEFYRSHLVERTERSPLFVFTSKNFFSLLEEGAVEEARKRFVNKVEELRRDTSGNIFHHREIIDRGLDLMAQQLILEGKTDIALKLIEWTLECYPQSIQVHLNAADRYDECGRVDWAFKAAEKAFRLIDESKDITPDQKKAFLKDVLAKIERWKR